MNPDPRRLYLAYEHLQPLVFMNLLLLPFNALPTGCTVDDIGGVARVAEGGGGHYSVVKPTSAQQQSTVVHLY